jgi:hypothetical protein
MRAGIILAPMARTFATVALALTLTACTHTQSVGARRTLHVAMTEYRLSPQSVRASAGTLTIVVHNRGRLAHDLVISQNGRVAGGTPPIMPGHGAELRVRLTRGKYLMLSNLFDDQALGLYGTLTVR